MVFTQANWGGLICMLIRCKHWVHSSIHQLAKLVLRKREEKHFISHKDVIFEARYTICDPEASGRYTRYDLRGTIYDVRFTMCDLRIKIAD
jgi:hypothetical protein